MKKNETTYQDPNPIIATFVVYDLFKDGTKIRLHETASGFETRLEKMIFYKRQDGSYEIKLQEGWFAGSHYDGCGNTFPIPRDFFSQTWYKFWEKLGQSHKTIFEYYSMVEILANKDLKTFLGISQ